MYTYIFAIWIGFRFLSKVTKKILKQKYIKQSNKKYNKNAAAAFEFFFKIISYYVCVCLTKIKLKWFSKKKKVKKCITKLSKFFVCFNFFYCISLCS